MPELAPDTNALAEKAAHAVRRGESVYVEGPVGAGRTSLIDALRRLHADRTAVVELLPLNEADAAGVALLEAASYLPSSDAPRWASGSEGELYTLAHTIGDRLHEHGKFLVLRIPDSWQEAEFSTRSADVLPLRARSVLTGFLRSAVPLVVVADAALTPSFLGYHPARRFQLPKHSVDAQSLGVASWGDYQDAYERMRSAAHSFLASPLAWRLAVGCVGLGAAVKAVVERLRLATPLRPLASLLSESIRSHTAVATSLARFLAVRRPVEREAVSALTKVDDAHLPLLTECVGYGAETTRVSPVVRGLLGAASVGSVAAEDHCAFAHHYAESDGARSPLGLSPRALCAWSERVHHLALGSPPGSTDWTDLDLPAPSFYWDRARHLSVASKDYAAAARVYEACVERFPDDDYSWHYLAFNLERAHGRRGTITEAYRKAIELNVENPWWNRRLVEFLIRDGAVEEARREWRSALDRVDPDGTQVSRSRWLAYNFHLGICRAWIAAGRLNTASAVLELVPHRYKKSGPLRSLAKRIEKGPQAWKRYLASLSSNERVGPALARHVRGWWDVLSEHFALPPPLADLTADEERFQLAWSYHHVLVEVEVHRDGSIEWFAKDRVDGTCDGGDSERAAVVDPKLRPWLEKIADA